MECYKTAMDPITSAVLAAIAKLAEPAVKDAYEALKKLLSRKFGGVKDAVDAVEKAPASKGRQMVLQEEVAKSEVTTDTELRAALDALTQALGKATASGTSITQNVSGNQNIFTGTGTVNVQQK
jgi:hypothetical protein